MNDPRDGSHAWWWGLAAVLAGALLVVLYTFVGTFVLGLFLYYAARPVQRRLQNRVSSPTLAATVALFVLALPVVLLFGYTATLAIGELETFVTSDLSVFEELLAPYLDVAGTTTEFQELLATLLTDPGQLMNEAGLRTFAVALATSVTESLGILAVGLLHLFIAVALSFYLLRDGDRLAAWTRATVDDETLRTYGRAVDADLQTVFFGNILNALLTGTIAAIVFSLLAAMAPPTVPVPAPFLLGLLAGAASLVPVVGMKLVYAPVTLVLAARALLFDPGALWFPVVFLVVTVVVVDTIPDIIIRPYVSGRNLHVGAVMFAYIFGPLLFGWYGLFLGPLLLVLVADFARIVLPDLVSGERTTATVSLTGKQLGKPSNGSRERSAPPRDAGAGPASEADAHSSDTEAARSRSVTGATADSGPTSFDDRRPGEASGSRPPSAGSPSGEPSGGPPPGRSDDAAPDAPDESTAPASDGEPARSTDTSPADRDETEADRDRDGEDGSG